MEWKIFFSFFWSPGGRSSLWLLLLFCPTVLSGAPWIPAIRRTIHNEMNGSGTLGKADSLFLKEQLKNTETS